MIQLVRALSFPRPHWYRSADPCFFYLLRIFPIIHLKFYLLKYEILLYSLDPLIPWSINAPMHIQKLQIMKPWYYIWLNCEFSPSDFNYSVHPSLFIHSNAIFFRFREKFVWFWFHFFLQFFDQMNFYTNLRFMYNK